MIRVNSYLIDYCKTITCWIFVILIAVLVISCSEQDIPSKKTQLKEPVKIDYFKSGAHTTAKINNIEYTIIDDYTKWIPVLYINNDFEAVEKHILGLLNSNDEAKSYELYALYFILGTITEDKYIELMQGALDEWCSKNPESHIPWLVRGSFYISYAWHIRGSSFAKSVPKKAWLKFYSKLELARDDLEKSWQINPHDPNSSSCLIIVAKGLSYPRKKMEQYYQNGIDACPWHFGLRFQKLSYLKPKWHGSSKEMFDFARQCLMQAEQYPYLGLTMAGALEEAHKYNPKDENLLGKDENWRIMEKIYRNFFRRYPNDIEMRFFYAYRANKAKKYDIAIQQFEVIGNQYMGYTKWDSIDHYNKGRSFAYYGRGVELLWQKKLYEISIEYFHSSIKYHPTANAYYGLGIAYWWSGYSGRDISMMKRAEKALVKALEIDPNHKLARKQLKELRKKL